MMCYRRPQDYFTSRYVLARQGLLVKGDVICSINHFKMFSRPLVRSYSCHNGPCTAKWSEWCETWRSKKVLRRCSFYIESPAFWKTLESRTNLDQSIRPIDSTNKLRKYTSTSIFQCQIRTYVLYFAILHQRPMFNENYTSDNGWVSMKNEWSVWIKHSWSF